MEKFFRAQEDHVTSSGLIIYLFVFKKISRGLKLIDLNSSKKKKKKPQKGHVIKLIDSKSN